MAHNYNDNGTIYEIGGGKDNDNGTVYEIDHGKVNVNGTVYSIEFGGAPVTVTCSGLSSKNYVEVNGTKHTASGTFQAKVGDKMRCVVSEGTQNNEIQADWNIVASGKGTVEYIYTLKSNVNVEVYGSTYITMYVYQS